LARWIAPATAWAAPSLKQQRTAIADFAAPGGFRPRETPAFDRGVPARNGRQPGEAWTTTDLEQAGGDHAGVLKAEAARTSLRGRGA
jgi:hypothetical protein